LITRWPAAACVALLGALAQAQPNDAHPREPQAAKVHARASVRIEPPTGLTAGTTASVGVFVRLPQGPEQPLLLTPTCEGDAVRVARGRLLRADARRTEQGELHFQVPIEARSAGTAVLRVALLTYRCDRRCEPLHLTESVTVQVSAR
jgi:hypothetical protein